MPITSPSSFWYMGSASSSGGSSGTGGSGCRVNPNLRSPAHPVEFVRFQLYLSAAGVKNLERADEEFVARLDELAATTPRGVRLALLAFDAHYTEDGAIDHAATEFYVPNEYIWELAERNPERYLPVISVNRDGQDFTNTRNNKKAKIRNILVMDDDKYIRE